MTQEIGLVDSERGKIDFEEFPIGKLLFMFPYHVRTAPSRGVALDTTRKCRNVTHMFTTRSCILSLFLSLLFI